MNDPTIKNVAKQLTDLAGRLVPEQLPQSTIDLLITGWKAKCHRSTVYRRVRPLRQFLKLIGSPITCATVPAPQARTVIASPEEINQLMQLAKPWQRAIILLALHAGLRRSDCMAAAPRHYDPQKGTLTLDQKKTGRTVVLPLTEALRELFNAVPEDTDRATPLYQILGGPPTARGVHVAWQRLKKQSGVNRALWLHDLRRTAAVSIYEVSKDLRIVEQLLGHSSLRSTAEYLEHRDPQKLRPYLDALWTPITKVIQ